MTRQNKYLVSPNIDDDTLTQEIQGFDQNNNLINTRVIKEGALTIFLNNQEIVTLMCIIDHPKYLAIGYLLNQNMINVKDTIKSINFDEDLNVVVVRTKRKTNYEKILKKKVTTSGCAQGTIFGNMYEEIKKIKIKSKIFIDHKNIYEISKKINLTPSLYLKVGAVHGCAIIKKNNPIIYMEDVGRHNAVDKIAGYMFLKQINTKDKIFYTTGRLTSEMIIKTIKMQIPILISRSGFTSWGVELAQLSNLTLIGRAKGKKYVALSGQQRVRF